MRIRDYLYWITFCLALLVLVPAACLRGDDYLASVMTSTGIYALIAIGLSLLLGYAGQISLGHAAFYAIGAYFPAVLGSKLAFSAQSAVWPWLWILAGVLVSAVVAVAIGIPSLRLRGHYLAMATLGFGVIVYEIAMALEITGGPMGVYGFPQLHLFGMDIDTDGRWYYTVWITNCLVMLFALHLIHSRTGRALLAIHGDETAARALGVNIARYKVQVFVLSAVLASLAGSFHVYHEAFVAPSSFTFHRSVEFVIMVVVGGMTSIWAALFGAVFISQLEEKLIDYQDWMLLFFGLILVLVMMFVPRGIFVSLADGAGRLARRLARRGSKGGAA